MAFQPEVTLSLPELLNQSSTGGYAGLVNMSQTTAALLLNAAVWFSDTRVWTGASGPPDAAEIDQIDAIVSEAIDTIMVSMVGTILPVATAVLPPRTLLCDGTTYLEADYPELYAALDPVFQTSPIDFVVPDLRNRFIYGEGTFSMGASGGARSVTLTTNQLPAHSHTYRANAPIAVTIGAGAPVSVANGIPTLSNTGNTGAGDFVNILNPYVALAYVIIAGRP